MDVFQLLRSQKFEGVSDTIETAKGKNKAPENFSEAFNQIKRKLKMKFK